MILTGNYAKDFVKKANDKKVKIDISEQIKITKAIIKKSKLKLN